MFTYLLRSFLSFPQAIINYFISIILPATCFICTTVHLPCRGACRPFHSNFVVHLKADRARLRRKAGLMSAIPKQFNDLRGRKTQTRNKS